MEQENRKEIALKCRESIISALRDVNDFKFLRRIYISILIAKNEKIGD